MNFTVDENSWCKGAEELNRRKLDSFRCFLGWLSATLYTIKFGYVCAFVSFLLVAISIFGKIKENYRWFILNQVIWDLLTSYKFTCYNWAGNYFFNDKSCSSSNSTFNDFLSKIPSAAYPALLLLSFSRFLCLYFPHFYEKLTKGRRIFITIFCYNLIVIATSLQSVIEFFQRERIYYIVAQIGGYNSPEWNSTRQNDVPLKIINAGRAFQNFSTSLKPVICLLLSVFATIMIIVKVSKQFKFQSKNNKKDFRISLRIAAVITFQTFLYCILFFLEGYYDIRLITRYLELKWELNDYFPTWCSGVQGLCSEVVRSDLIQIRILIESFFILFVMSGYREAVFKFIKYILSRSGIKFKGKNIRITPVTTIQRGTTILSSQNLRQNQSQMQQDRKKSR